MKISSDTAKKLKCYAADPDVTLDIAAERLGMTRSQVWKASRTLDLPWKRKGRGRHGRPIDYEQLVGMAQDPLLSMTEASTRLRTSLPRLREEVRKHGLEWQYKALLRRGTARPANVKKKPSAPASAPLPQFTLQQAEMMGRHGYSWYCPTLRAKGWCQAETQQAAEERITSIIQRAFNGEAWGDYADAEGGSHGA